MWPDLQKPDIMAHVKIFVMSQYNSAHLEGTKMFRTAIYLP